ncbi:MarR family winged helix-turn-helix transcriptional regulator [Subtercola sp. RTI3]|uniref:MarR family winged helix-turn-helix transcriptional regulator n=1 Tax=Subtercola sp. RTI3 TaxID=3048639 RepID=UPI002B232009|nr:MarR family transcriptional regulator [Subtercola sp. RTI3]MEA9987176.1 MarR family transcriptional regulator [Subtercola sp. RTI3]
MSNPVPEEPSLFGDGAPAMRQASILFRQILSLMGEFERVLQAHLKVNGTDLEAMELLIEHGPMSPTELAHGLGISTAATTLVIDRLEKVGHADREAHPSDRRSVRVVPAVASVSATFAALRPLILGVDGVLDDFSASERNAIESYLSKVAGVYRDVILESHPST